ncbi:MAG: hypothetical protein IH955_03650, partial [Chloroflexi bacterium]|nr:hypothetical protein [Chloroflexota bacterium]
MSKGREFRQLLAENDYVYTTGVYNALDASIAEKVGLKCVYMSGYSTSHAILARADLGFPTFSLETLGNLAEQGRYSVGFQTWVFPLFMVGFGVLAGLWPFHTWSPDGHVAAPTGVSMLHAGVLMKLGSYG